MNKIYDTVRKDTRWYNSSSSSRNKCVSKTHMRQTRGGGSYNVQHRRPLLKGNISVADYMPLSSL